MTSTHPLMIAVAPNGARKQHSDHPRLPITAREIALTAAACAEAGACMLHLHVRDADNRHSLDAARYREAIAAIRSEAGDELIIQVTTEAVGIYTREEQMQTVVEVRPEAVSLAIREICPPGSNEKATAEFFSYLQRERIKPQYILYSEEDIQHFATLLERGIIPDERISVLLVLGRYTENQESDPAELDALVRTLPPVHNWSLCAFGASETACMLEAIRRGGHCRVGFENNLFMHDGSLAQDNAALVSSVREGAATLKRDIASAAQAREFLGMR